MAPDLDEHQLRELAAFVNAIASKGGYETSASWARDANYPEPNLSKLRNARSGVDGYNLFKLIRAAARRIDERPVDVAVSSARNVELDEAPSRAELALHLQQLEGLLADALARLAGGIKHESEQPPDAESPTA